LVSEKREKHKGCRKAQQSWEIFRADAETVGNSMFGNAIGVPDSIPVSAIDTLCAKRDNWVDHKRDYKDLAKVNNVASCATEQKAFENTMCTVLTAKASTCIAYDECIVAVNLQNEKTVTEAECDDRLAVEVVLAKTKCHLLHLSKVFNNEEDSTSDCDSVTVEDSSLVCTLQPVPAVSPCSSEADITSPTLPSPDGSDCSVWIAAEYSFDASYKPVTSCRIEEPCVLPTLIGTHDYSDGCTNSDSANICDFYDRHSDACSDYPGDDAVNKCCACGGGTPVGTKPNRCDFQGVCPPVTNGSWTLKGAATWTKGTGSASATTCTQVCNAIGKSCTDESMDLQARVCSPTVVTDMNIFAGGAGTTACKSSAKTVSNSARTYAGTPFQQFSPEDGCYYFNPAQCGDMSACDENINHKHYPFCACMA